MKEQIEIISKRVLMRISVNSILFVKTDRNVTEIYTQKKILRTYMTFNKFSELLHEFPQFLTCYKGCIVNMEWISKVSGEDFQMVTGEKIQMRKRGSSKIKEVYYDYRLLKTEGFLTRDPSIKERNMV